MRKRVILEAGKHCWRKLPAARATVLIDAASYFQAVWQAAQQARDSILILCWDIDSGVCLVRDGADHPWPVQLRDFLNALVSARPELRIHILAWDFAMIYALEREALQTYKFQWQTHPSLQFWMDDQHPIGASHHQKIVVIDDTLAFVGGLDLTRSRWDTPEHRTDDPRRVENGRPYAPFHDLQMMVNGEVAAALGDLVRRRWWRATGQRLAPPLWRKRWRADSDVWPSGFKADFEGVDVAIARTEPALAEAKGIHEIESLFLTVIAAAQRFIYIENQYLTSAAIGAAFARRLQERDGPEIIAVLPKETGGWLEQATMDVLRARLLKSLRAADRYGRLRLYYPALPGCDSGCMVHGKLLIVDDELLTIGSANLSNRSMGFDTECNLVLEAGSKVDVRNAIAAVRRRLLAEHLGTAVATVADAETRQPTLGAAIEHLQGGERTLLALDANIPEVLDKTIPDASLIDPAQPLEAERIAARLLAQESKKTHGWRYHWLTIVALLVAVLGLAALWRWTLVGDGVSQAQLLHWLGALRGSNLGLPVAVLGFVVASLTAFPITVLILVTAVAFGPLLGFLYSLLGALTGAMLTYAIGYRLGGEAIRRMIGERSQRLSQHIANQGLLALIVVRVLPLAPFTLINLAAGACRVRLRDYLLGTLLGMTPGMLAFSAFADGVLGVLTQPGPEKLAWAALIAVLIIAGVCGLRYRLGTYAQRPDARKA